MHVFTIFTLSHTRAFLPSVARSLSEADIPSDVELRWVTRFNPTIKLPRDEHFRRLDEEIFRLSGTWVFQLSDDNLLHPSLIRRWRDMIEVHPEMKMLHVRQQFGPGAFRPANHDYLKGGHCDGGQVVFQSEWYKKFGYSYVQFRKPNSSWEGDVYKAMKEKDPTAVQHLDELLAYHDRLRW